MRTPSTPRLLLVATGLTLALLGTAVAGASARAEPAAPSAGATEPAR